LLIKELKKIKGDINRFKHGEKVENLKREIISNTRITYIPNLNYFQDRRPFDVYAMPGTEMYILRKYAHGELIMRCV
jgi:signal peptidase I